MTLYDVIEQVEHGEFHYLFMNYSFKDVSDHTFHILRDQYIQAAKNLQEYLEQETGVTLD